MRTDTSHAQLAEIRSQKEIGDAAVFFRTHSEYSHPADITDRAVQTCHWDAQSIMLAGAEREAKLRGWEMSWGEDDWEAHRSDDMPPETCELATLWDADSDGTGEPLASLGCVDDADDVTRRVVAAQLALEALGW